MAINAGMMSSATDQWATPQELFDKLDTIYNFNLDVCASDWNAKCDRYFNEEQNGLAQEWVGTCWMNPPYGRTIKEWVKKAYESAGNGTTVVCLIPARTDTAWWHDYVMKGDITFLRGRVKFVSQTNDKDQSAPFPSAIVVFK